MITSIVCSARAPMPWLSLKLQIACCAAVVHFFAPTAGAKVFLTTDEALKLAFPGCTVTRQTVYLTGTQKAAAEQFAGVPFTSNIVYPYVAVCSGRPAGTAWFDVHRVRTLPETLMIAVDPTGKVRRIEVLSFKEPQDYLPRGNWYAQFVGKALSPELALKRDIRAVSGATLTARATTEAVRRVLAIQRVLEQEGRRP